MVNDPLKISHAAYDAAMLKCKGLKGMAKLECIRKATKLRPKGGV